MSPSTCGASPSAVSFQPGQSSAMELTVNRSVIAYH